MMFLLCSHLLHDFEIGTKEKRFRQLRGFGAALIAVAPLGLATQYYRIPPHQEQTNMPPIGPPWTGPVGGMENLQSCGFKTGRFPP
jgi:hypothetical protein